MGPDPGEIYATNLEGTRNVMQAALRAGVERDHTSSVATIALRSGEIADESTPLPENEAIGAYKRSKIAAERLVDSMVAEQGLPAVIVNPSTPIGPRDEQPTGSGSSSRASTTAIVWSRRATPVPPLVRIASTSAREQRFQFRREPLRLVGQDLVVRHRVPVRLEQLADAPAALVGLGGAGVAERDDRAAGGDGPAAWTCWS